MFIGRSEGVILEVKPYEEDHRIITFFTPNEGMMRLFARKERSGESPIPLTRVECVFSYRNEETLVRLKELVLLEPFLELRQSFQTLRITGSLAQVLLQSQLLWKPAPRLYQLLLIYLRQAPVCLHPENYLSSFLLKLLLHEGLLGVTLTCSQCKQSFTEAVLVPGETLCPAHAPDWGIRFDEGEMLALCQLAAAKSLKDVYEIILTPVLGQKIQNLFDHFIN